MKISRLSYLGWSIIHGNALILICGRSQCDKSPRRLYLHELINSISYALRQIAAQGSTKLGAALAIPINLIQYLIWLNEPPMTRGKCIQHIIVLRLKYAIAQDVCLAHKYCIEGRGVRLWISQLLALSGSALLVQWLSFSHGPPWFEVRLPDRS